MTHRRSRFPAGELALTLLLTQTLLLPLPAVALQAAEALSLDGDAVQSVDFAFVKSTVTFPARPDVTIVDTRPTAAEYDASHIPGAITMPHERFDQLVARLPPDRKHSLIFYCDDAICPSGRLSAFKAVKLGYSNARVYSAGLADWVSSDGVTSVSAAYISHLAGSRAPHRLIDARPARTAAKGMIPGAINIPDADFDKQLDKLPANKNILLIFYCGGIDCPQSANAAEKARKLGYTNVRTYPEGYPEWLRLQPPPPAGN